MRRLPRLPPRRTSHGRKRSRAEAEEGGPEGALPALTLGIGGSGMNRSLSWHQDLNNALAPYSLGAGPEAAVWLEAYPAAFSTAGFVVAHRRLRRVQSGLRRELDRR